MDSHYHQIMLEWLETARYLKAIGDYHARVIALEVARRARRKHRAYIKAQKTH